MVLPSRFSRLGSPVEDGPDRRGVDTGGYEGVVEGGGCEGMGLGGSVLPSLFLSSVLPGKRNGPSKVSTTSVFWEDLCVSRTSSEVDGVYTSPRPGWGSVGGGVGEWGSGLF